MAFHPEEYLCDHSFQGIGQGEKALTVTFLRTLIFQLVFSYLFGITLKFGVDGVWSGIIIGNLTASTIAFIWGRVTIIKLNGKTEVAPPSSKHG